MKNRTTHTGIENELQLRLGIGRKNLKWGLLFICFLPNTWGVCSPSQKMRHLDEGRYIEGWATWLLKQRMCFLVFSLSPSILHVVVIPQSLTKWKFYACMCMHTHMLPSEELWTDLRHMCLVVNGLFGLKIWKQCLE